MAKLHTLLAAVAVLACGAPALAGEVTLRPNPVDADGRVTLGDIFDGAGAAADVAVAQRTGPSVVLEAGQLQAQARQAGLDWSNPPGLRRVAVRRAAAVQSAVQNTAEASQPAPVAASIQPGPRAVAGQPVIARNDMVRVTYEVGGVRLSVMGKAQRSARVGEPVAVLNTTSNRTIDAVATGPGTAMAAGAAQQFASR
ncbi:flagella basal body P-ring formation protein FlgA [Brevundimonas sp. PAMC22021]|uniref:flagella basal body P-ring formation protein FlgA n=1 Tax=Brevundimonas sp. PAMC22021 TaxID=2861285 RepID=UPI001C63A585|nr:flagella basal body P-ring formation protein FlgA [Brevundimonas sp. PAMC22021]QYF87416.1 flagella basal body P-ring formation protein FlgA [Brevundimonas sp. PAMC22021]